MSDDKYRAILERDPTDIQAFLSLCESAERSNDFQYLVQLYEFRAQVIADTKEIADLQFRAGEVYLDKLDDIAGGVQALLKGFDADRTHAGIGDRLDVVYREAGDWESAVQIAEQRLEALTSADSNGTKTVIRSDLHQQAGEIWEKVYADKVKALNHYKKAIELDKSNLLALYGAREIYYEAGKYKNAAKLCELEARCEKDNDRKGALYRELAHIFSKKLTDPEQAVTALKRALKFAPKNKDVKDDLAQAIALTDLVEDNEKDHRWAADYFLRNAASDDNAALEYAGLAIAAYPADHKAMDFLEQKAGASGRWRDAAFHYEDAISRIKSPAGREPVIRRLAALYSDKLHDPVKAQEWLGKLGLTDVGPARALGDQAGGRSSAISETEFEPDMEMPEAAPAVPSQPPLRTQVDRAPSPAAVPVREIGMSEQDFIEELRKAAETARRGGDDATAEECLLGVLDLEPHDQKATTYLERRFRARSDWLSLRDLLLRSAGAPQLPQAVQTVRLREAARLSEEQLHDVLGAISAWQTIKTTDPKVRDATDALIRLFEQAERWEDLLAILREEIESTKSRTKQVDALRKLADVYHQQLHDYPSAAKGYRALLKLAPDDKDAIEALDEIYLKGGNYEELVALLKQRAEMTPRRDEKRNHLFKAAVVLRDNLERVEEAYELGKEVLTLSRDDNDVVEFLISIDEESEEWQRLVGLLEIRTRYAKTTEEKIEIIRKRGLIAKERLDDKRGAVKAFNELLAFSPKDADSLDVLATIHRDSSEWKELADILKQQIDLVTDKVEAVEIHRELARILEHELKREEEAMASWQAVLEVEPDAESLGALARFYERKRNWKEYIKVIEQQAAFAEDHQQRAEILFNRAVIIDTELRDRERATEEFQRILNEVDPTHDGALNRLIEILVEKGNFEQAADLLDQRISYAKDKDLAKKMLKQLGTWARDELDDLDRAMDSFEKAVSLDKEDAEALDLLDGIYVSLKQWDKLLKLIYARAKATAEDNVALDMLVRGAKVAEEEVGDKQKAWSWYVEMLDRLSHLPETIEIVEESARRMELWKELIDIAGAMTRTTQLESDQVVWWLKAADILETKMNDPGQALEAVLRAFGLEPDNEELLDRVDKLAVTVQNWQRLSTVYGVLVNRAPEKREKIELLKRYAKVLSEEANRPSDAFDIIVKAFELEPTSDELLGLVENMGNASERWDDLIRIYGGCAKLSDDIDQKVELKIREAGVYRDKKVDPDSALISFVKALRFDPFGEATKEKIWGEIRRLEDDLVPSESGTFWNKLIEGYRVLADEHKDDRERQVELLFQVSEIYVTELKDITSAFSCMKEIQQLNPRDETTIDRLEELAEKNRRWDELVDHYRDILDETFEMDVAIMLHRRRARILEQELNRGDEAAEHYWQIIQLDSSDPTAYGMLVSYYEGAKKWNELVNMLERQLDNTKDDDARKDILFRIAEIWEVEIGNRYEAKDWYEQILTIWPDDKKAEACLAHLVDGRKVADDDADDDADSPSGDDDDINELISMPPPRDDVEMADASDSISDETMLSRDEEPEEDEPEDEEPEEDEPEDEEPEEDEPEDEEPEEDEPEDGPDEESLVAMDDVSLGEDDHMIALEAATGANIDDAPDDEATTEDEAEEIGEEGEEEEDLLLDDDDILLDDDDLVMEDDEESDRED